jgi:hypothetical protein
MPYVNYNSVRNYRLTWPGDAAQASSGFVRLSRGDACQMLMAKNDIGMAGTAAAG